jgi:hypothetical protein
LLGLPMAGAGKTLDRVAEFPIAGRCSRTAMSC